MVIMYSDPKNDQMTSEMTSEIGSPIILSKFDNLNLGGNVSANISLDKGKESRKSKSFSYSFWNF